MRQPVLLKNSLSQNLTVLTAPSEREPLAKPESLQLSQKLSRYAKGYPLRLTTFASSPKGTPLHYAGNLTAATKSRPLGEGGIAAGDDGRGISRGKLLCT